MRVELRSLLSRVFSVPADSFDGNVSPDTLSAWDSLGHLQLVSAIEGHFKLRFNLREIQTMDSAEKIEAILAARGV